jgi:hypothetical protein
VKSDYVKIAGVIYKLIVPYQFREKALEGQIDTAMGEIRLSTIDDCGNEKIQPRIFTELLHEILHGISHHWCIGLTEEQVERLSQGLWQSIVDNPELYKEMLEKE